jgi:hypothetical protein
VSYSVVGLPRTIVAPMVRPIPDQTGVNRNQA